MQTATMTVILLALFFCFPVDGSGAQELSSLIQSSIADKEPQWAIVARESEGDTTIYRWKNGEERVVAQMFPAASAKGASERLWKEARRFSIPPNARPKDLGDEALLWENTGGGTILFRKSKVFILITGSSSTSVKRFARHIEELIPTK
jgi:hypothetical protein